MVQEYFETVLRPANTLCLKLLDEHGTGAAKDLAQWKANLVASRGQGVGVRRQGRTNEPMMAGPR